MMMFGLDYHLGVRCSVCGLFIIIAFFVTIKFCIFFYWAFLGWFGDWRYYGIDLIILLVCCR